MAIADIIEKDDFDGIGGPGNSGNPSNLPTNPILLSPISFNKKEATCAFIPIDQTYTQKLAYQNSKNLNFGDTIYEFSINIKVKFNGGNKWWALAHNGGSPLIGASRALRIDSYGQIREVFICSDDQDANVGDIIISDPTPPSKSSIPSPTSNLIYNYFVLENLSRSKKIFAYYSGSQNFNYTFSTDTTSADPGSGFFKLNQGPEGTGGNEDAATELYIDIKDNQGEEDIITYLTSLSSSLAKTGTPADPYGEVQLFISGSGADQFYHRFNLQNVTFEGSNPAVDGYFKLDIDSLESDPGSNPLSSSIAAGSGSNVEVRFFNDIIPGYHETEVTSLDKDYVIACVTQTASYGSGSISQPFAISWGMPESEFLNPDFYPTQPGYAWLWNDGYKVKHIKINNQSFGGDTLTDFVKRSDWSRFVLYNPFNAQGNLLHPSNGNYPETFYLHNVTKFTQYSHLFVDQENRDTTFAVDSNNFASTNHNFLAEGKYIIDAKASGTVVEPIITTNISESLPQGYFPSASSNYPQEQFFRGWVDANYYLNGTLVGTGGNYSDPLRQFETGSTERDYDAAPSYIRSTLPFFINATSSYIPISSSDFGTYSSQPNTVRVGPGLRTTGGDVLSYYYEETTGKILISGAEHLDTKKTENYIFNNLYDTELVAPSNETTTYITPDLSYIIEVKPSQSLWLSRGRDATNAGDTDRYKYNRYLHRPYKAYVLLGTGSTDAGYGGDEFSSGIYGEGTVPVGPPVNEAVQIFMHYSQSSANLRSDGIYTFDTLLSEDVGLTASVDLSYRSDTYVPPTVYGESTYGDGDSEYGGAGSGTDILTWRTASLNIYKNTSLLTSSLVQLEPADIEAGSTLVIKYPLTQNEIATGDTLKLALEVNTTDTQAFNAALVATSYTMSIGGTIPPTDDKIPVTFNNYLELNEDCDPLVSNIVIDRPNARLQDVDYSSPISGSLYPVNFDQIIRDEAVRATVPESNYTKLSSINPRYVGSSISRREINEYNVNDPVDQENRFYYPGDVGNANYVNKGKGPSIGKLANIELKNSYIAYFNKLIDPYPVLNGKTAYYVKYLIDESGTIFDPTLSDINFSIFEKTFQLSDYNNKPTKVKIGLNNIDEIKELSKLNKGLSDTFILGKYPVPVLYTQTSAESFTDRIPLSGSPFFGTFGIGEGDWLNQGIKVFSTQSHFPIPNPADDVRKKTTNISPAITTYFKSEDITKYQGNEYIPTASFGSTPNAYVIEMGLDNLGTPANTQGGTLSDEFKIIGQFEFTTTTCPGRYRYKTDDWEDYDNADLYSGGQSRDKYRQPFNLKFTPYKNNDPLTQNFRLKSVLLEIVTSPGTNQEFRYNPITIPSNVSGFGYQWQKIGVDYVIKPDSVYLEKAIIQDMLGENWRSTSIRRKYGHLVGGGYTPKRGGNGTRIEGCNGIAVIYNWKLEFEITNLKQDDEFYFQTEGEWTFARDNSQYGSRSIQHGKDFFHHHNGGSNFSKDTNYRTDNSWQGTFQPNFWTYNSNVTGTYDTLPVLTLDVTSPLSANDQAENQSTGPYWRRVSGTTDMLYMSSSILNQAYGIFDNEGTLINGQYYVQAEIPYTSGTNTAYPNTKEPDFVKFDPVSDPWSLEIGDEIRFENNEDLVYTITSKEGRQAITPPRNPDSTDPENDGLRIVVTPPFEYTGSDGTIEVKEPKEFDFFVVRRFKENKNFLILNQQTPYGFPVTGSLKPTSSPGIALPEYRIEKYNRNPDEVLKDLIEKRII